MSRAPRFLVAANEVNATASPCICWAPDFAVPVTLILRAIAGLTRTPRAHAAPFASGGARRGRAARGRGPARPASSACESLDFVMDDADGERGRPYEVGDSVEAMVEKRAPPRPPAARGERAGPTTRRRQQRRDRVARARDDCACDRYDDESDAERAPPHASGLVLS